MVNHEPFMKHIVVVGMEMLANEDFDWGPRLGLKRMPATKMRPSGAKLGLNVAKKGPSRKLISKFFSMVFNIMSLQISKMI